VCLILFVQLVVEQDTTFELCGGLAARTRDLDIQVGGTLKTFYPAYTGTKGDASAYGHLSLFSIKTRAGGIAKSSNCGTAGDMTLQLTYLNKTRDFSLPAGISVSAGASEVGSLID
jgi:hypothetical protein